MNCMGGGALRIAYVAFRSPEDISYWSSVPYWTVRKLSQRGHHVIPHVYDKRILRLALYPIECANRILGRVWLPEWTRPFLAVPRRWLAAKLRQDRYDVIFCEGSIQAACVGPAGRSSTGPTPRLRAISMPTWGRSASSA
jgi:hypothetical protein